MRRLLPILLLGLVAQVAQCQVSYWFSGWERKPDAAQAQAYFMMPGSGVWFTYQTNRVIINATGGTSCCQVVSFATNASFAVWATNWTGSNALWGLLNSSFTNLLSSNNVWTGSNNFTGPLLQNGVPVCTNCTGGTNVTVGLSTNICVLFCDSTTNTLTFTNGVLVAISGAGPPVSSFLIQPAGAGYILQPGGDKILLP